MANYAPPGFGSHFNNQAPNGSLPSAYPPVSQGAYPPIYPTQNDGRSGPSSMSMDYGSSMSAYGYNAGIPNYHTPPTIPPMQGYQPWDKPSYPQMPYSPAQPPSSYGGFPGTPQHGMGQPSPYFSSFASQGQPAYQPPPASISQPPVNQHVAPPPEMQEPSIASRGPSFSYTPQQAYKPSGNGFADSANRAIFPRADEYSPALTMSNMSNNSNHLSTNQRPAQKWTASATDSTARSAKPTTPVSSTTNSATKSSHKPETSQNHGQDMSDNIKIVPTEKNARDTRASTETLKPTAPLAYTGESIQQAGAATAPVVANGVNTVESARKKAERAILNLWDYDVRLPQYLQAGIDPAIVENLFDNLKLSRAPLQPVSNNIPQSAQKPIGLGSVNQGNVDAQSVNSQKIASSHSAEKPLHSPPEQPRRKSAAVVEKEKNLQLKMEALKKSREERALKKAAKEVLVSPTAAADPSSTADIAAATDANVSPAQTKSEQASAKVQTQPVTTGHVPAIVTTALPNPPRTLIPGLGALSAASSKTTLPLPVTDLKQVVVNPRKRPVAADLYQANDLVPTKRPFGHSKQGQDLVIDVSDDDNESDNDVDMDLDSPIDQRSPISSTKHASDKEPEVRTSTPFTPPSRKANRSAPPRPSPREAIELESKTRAIEEMKRRIASLEHRKKLSRQNSGLATPTMFIPNARPLTATETLQGLKRIEEGLAKDTVAASQSTDRNPVASTRLSEPPSIQASGELSRQEMRRRQIAAVLPHVDASIDQKRRELAELEAKQFDLQNALRKAMNDRAKLEGEMAKLSHEDVLRAAAEEHQQGMASDSTHIALPDESRNDHDVSPSTATQPNTQSSASEPSVTILVETEPTSASQVAPKSPSGFSTPVERSQTDGAAETEVPKPISVQSPVEEEVNHPLTVVDNDANSHDANEPVQVEGLTIVTEATPEPSAVTRHDLENALQEAVRAEAEESEDEEMMDIEEITPTVITHSHLGSHRDSSDLEEGELGDTYSPVLAASSPVLAATSLVVTGDESDFYEPPEATADVNASVAVKATAGVNTTEVLESPPFSPASPESQEESQHAEDIALAVTNDVPHKDEMVGIESTTQDQMEATAQVDMSGQVHDTPDEKHRFFKPYSSALRNFRAFRYHPEFQTVVRGGLRSISFSHKIDPNKELCRYELAGGSCNDKSCEFQHFRDMNLADDEILRVLGSPDEFTGDGRERFITSLKAFLGDLRQRGIRDFETIATEITAHRAAFLGDKSKVLVLEGADI